MSEKSKFAGMTVNERLFEAGLTAAFDRAALRKDREEMIRILQEVDLTEEGAGQTVDNILARPEMYGY